MRRKYKGFLLVTVMIFSMIPFNVKAAEDFAKGWNYYSPIQLEGTSRYKALYLPEEVYEHALSNLADLRIIDKNGNTVPYYIQNGQSITEKDEFVYQSELVTSAQQQLDTRLDFKIQPIRDDTDIIGNILEFTFQEKNFLKHLTIQGSYDGLHWDWLGKDYIYQTEGLHKNKIILDKAYKYNYYRVTVLDNAEQITLLSLNLLYDTTETEWQRYEKTAELNYEIREEDRKTIIILENPQHLKIKEVFLNVEGNFQRPYRLYDSNQNEIMADGIQELYNFNFKDIEISNTQILIRNQAVRTDKMLVVIENYDSPPLYIKGLSVRYDVDKIVFEDQGNAPYRLYYGNTDAVQPQYDLVSFQKYIEKEKQDLVALGEIVSILEEENEQKSWALRWVNSKTVFNGVIVLVSLTLIVILLKRFR